MTKVSEVAHWVDGFAPKRLAESWDNVGLLWGDPDAEVCRVMTCLTVTAKVAREAVEAGVNLIVSHHPVLFRAAKSVRADRHETAPLWMLARAGIAVISPHTAFDNATDGINALLAGLLRLRDVAELRPAARPASGSNFKVVVFTPRLDREAVMSAAFDAGAGRIGEYEECSFTTPGVGTFFGLEQSNPTVGQAGRRESVRESRLEFVCPGSRLDAVLAAIRKAHSYEEPAIDVYPTQEPHPAGPGAGRVGNLEEPITLVEFARRVKSALNADCVQFVGPSDRMVRRIAICCGAGDDFLPDALAARADALLTGEARFHRALEAESTEIGLVLAGHHATERPGVEYLAARIGEAFPRLQVWASRVETDPLQTLLGR